MTDILNVQGSIVALVTPFKKNGEKDQEVDYIALRKLVSWHIDSGTAAIIPCGTTGEASTLSDLEYEKVVSTVVEEANKRVPIIAGAGSNSTKKAVEYGKIAKSAGADGLLVVTPYYNKPTVNGLILHFKTIGEEVQLPTLVYNVPGRTAQNVLPETIISLAELEYVYGVKEASGSIQQCMEIVAKKPLEFKIYSGDDALTLGSIAVGADGVISVCANQIPVQMATLCSYALAGDFQKARSIHYKYFELMSKNFIESNPIPVKYTMSKMGLIEEVYRLPLTGLSQENKKIMDAVSINAELIKV